jgi:hypothetical protein
MVRAVVAAILIIGACVTAVAGSVRLLQLHPGDRVHVSFHSRGCFHDRGYEIDFEPGPPVTARSAGRAVTLSAQKVTGLEKLFDFYRTRPRGGCTTQDDISIRQFRGVQTISSEDYVDGSCATYRMKDVSRLYDIAKKLGLENDKL